MSDALKKLIDAVGAGEDFVGAPLNMAVDALSADCGTTDYEFAVWFRDAARGSLDAAKALHDSLLPGWTRAVDATEPGMGIAVSLYPAGDPLADDYSGPVRGDLPCEARAWLFAILKAKLQEDQG